MLDADLLKHPVIRDCVDALVDGRGGLVVYGQGLGAGRHSWWRPRGSPPSPARH